MKRCLLHCSGVFFVGRVVRHGKMSVWAVGAAVRLIVCVVPFCSVRFSEFLNLRFTRGGAPRSTWKKKEENKQKRDSSGSGLLVESRL